MLDLPVGYVVNNNSRRLNIGIVPVLLKVIPGTVGNGANDTGQRDLHSSQESKHSQNSQKNIRNWSSAQPAQKQRDTAADYASGVPFHTADVKIGNHRESGSHPLSLHCQMVDTAAGKDKQENTGAAHGNSGFPAEHMDNKNVQKPGNGNVKAGLSDQPQNNGLNDFQKCPLRVNTDYKE